jgi:hypothetical protein
MITKLICYHPTSKFILLENNNKNSTVSLKEGKGAKERFKKETKAN